MLASLRMSASHPWMIASKAFERWLISNTDMPTPGRAIRSRCASSRTGSGRTAGPAPKLKMRLVIRTSQRKERQLDDVRAALANRLEDAAGRRLLEVDAGDGCPGSVEDDVFGLLDVDAGLFEAVENRREDAHAIVVAHDEQAAG